MFIKVLAKECCLDFTQFFGQFYTGVTYKSVAYQKTCISIFELGDLKIAHLLILIVISDNLCSVS